MNLRMPKQEPGEPHWSYAQRLADHAQFAANVSIGFAIVAVVFAVLAVVIG